MAYLYPRPRQPAGQASLIRQCPQQDQPSMRHDSLTVSNDIQAVDQQALAADSGAPEPGARRPEESGDFYHARYLSSI